MNAYTSPSSLGYAPARRRLIACLLPVLSVVHACAVAEPDSTEEEPLEVGGVSEAVVGGKPVEACQWPSTVSVNGWGSCTGTLIHPRIITTAAHCIMNTQTNIYFGGGRNQAGAFSLSARCKTGAQGSRGANTGKDWAYCVLPEDERVKQIPITPPLVGCEAERYLKAGTQAWVVGFGITSANGGGAGVKRQVPVMINALNKQSPGTLDVGDAMQGACHGDSGGPLYVHVQDGTHDYGYRVVGSTSGAGARACDCTCSTVYVNIANHVKAIEETEKIDVTPCTDANGMFEPSPACNALMTTPQEGKGTFPGCQVAHTLEAINSCGPAAPSAPTAGTPAAGSGGLVATAGRLAQPTAAGAPAALAGAPAIGGIPAIPVSGSPGVVAPVTAQGVTATSVGVGGLPASGSLAAPTAGSTPTAGTGTMTFSVLQAGSSSPRPEPTPATGCAAVGGRHETPSALLFLGSALLGLVWRRRRS